MPARRSTDEETRTTRRASTARRAPAKRAAKRSAQPAKKAAKKAAKRSAQPAKKAAKKAAKRSAQPAKKAAKKAAKRSAKRSAQPTKKAAKRSAQPAKKAAKRSAQPTKKAAKKAAKRPARTRAQIREQERRERERQEREQERKRQERNARRRAQREAERLARLEEERLRQERNARRRERYRAQREEAARIERVRRGERFPRPAEERPTFDRIDELGRAYHDQRKAAIEKKKADWIRRYGRKVALQAATIEEGLAFIASNLRMEGWPQAKESVRPYADGTIDGELLVDIPPTKATARELTEEGGLIPRLNEHFRQMSDTKLLGCYFQIGFILPSESQRYTQGTGKKMPYKRYEDRLRFGYHYKKLTRDTGTVAESFTAARLTVLGILDKHERPPSGIYVRISWSKDGSLRRRR